MSQIVEDLEKKLHIQEAEKQTARAVVRQENNDHEEDEDDMDEEDHDSVAIQLGFIEREEQNQLFLEKDWRNWDGGKVGGLPIWLDPVSAPSPALLQCGNCHDPLCFLLQIYCPFDNLENAFHRSVYVYTCKKRSCIETGR
jgi:pre-rRNA-processing protein TSR4